MKLLILVAGVLFFISMAFKSALSAIQYPSRGILLPTVHIYGSKVSTKTTKKVNAEVAANTKFTATPWQPAGC